MLNQGLPTRLVFSCNRECFQSLVPDHLKYASLFVTSLPTYYLLLENYSKTHYLQLAHGTCRCISALLNLITWKYSTVGL